MTCGRCGATLSMRAGRACCSEIWRSDKLAWAFFCMEMGQQQLWKKMKIPAAAGVGGYGLLRHNLLVCTGVCASGSGVLYVCTTAYLYFIFSRGSNSICSIQLTTRPAHTCILTSLTPVSDIQQPLCPCQSSCRCPRCCCQCHLNC